MKASRHFLLVAGIVGILFFCQPIAVHGGSACVVPDNGTGTATLPPVGCEYTSPGDVFKIIDGFPPGTTIEMVGILKDFICCGSGCTLCSVALPPDLCETVGGTLGGNVPC